MVKENGGQENMDNIEVWSNDHLASSFPEPNKEGNMTEVEMSVDVLQGNETSQVFPPDTLEVSMVKEKGSQDSKDSVEEDNAESKLHGSDDDLASSFSEPEEEENMTEKGGDNAGSEVHKKNSREMSNI
eukprot:4921499-Ditylum_brightwellii.AAC.1